MTDFLEEAEAVAVKAAKEAAKVLMKHFRTELRIETKGNQRSIVTIADKESDALIRKIILEKFPDHGIISEENKPIKADSEYAWHIDPLDGTTNYSRKSKQFCVSIALAKGDDVVVGVILSPFFGETYTAVMGKGASLNGRAIRVSGVKKLEEAVVNFDMCYEEEKRLQTAKLIKKMVLAKSMMLQGSAAIALCEVASGVTDAYVHVCGSSWDFAAGALIIREAGGAVKDFDSKEWSPRIKNGLVASCNETLNKEIMAKVNEQLR